MQQQNINLLTAPKIKNLFPAFLGVIALSLIVGVSDVNADTTNTNRSVNSGETVDSDDIFYVIKGGKTIPCTLAVNTENERPGTQVVTDANTENENLACAEPDSKDIQKGIEDGRVVDFEKFSASDQEYIIGASLIGKRCMSSLTRCNNPYR